MIILGTNSIKDTGFDVDNSLRFNNGSSDRLTRTTTGSVTNADKVTFSAWIKRSAQINQNISFWGEYYDTNNRTEIGLNSTNDHFYIYGKDGGSTYVQVETNASFRDVSAWYHFVLAYDSTDGTAANRVKMYVNGVQITSFATATYPNQNTDIRLNSTNQGYSVGDAESADHFWDGYMCEVAHIDGQQLAADQFGEFDSDSGIWKPIDISGLTFGTNGYYLQFKQSGVGTNASGMGADTSGNDNHFAVNNLTAVDQSSDTCTNNSSNINALSIGSGVTLSEGNLQVLMDASAQFGGHSTIGVSTGKWYCEIKYSARTDADRLMLGISGNPNLLAYASPFGSGAGYVGGAQEPTSYGYYSDGGNSFNNDNSSSYGASYTVGDIIGIALDLDNNKLYFSKNGTFQNSGDPTSGSTGTGAISIGAASGTNTGNYFFAVSESSGSYGHTTQCNFGSPPYAISSGNTDGNGYGNFEYAVPSGYYALNTKNLAEYG